MAWTVTKYLVDQNLEASELLDPVRALMDPPYWYQGWIFQEICSHNVPITISLADQAYEFGNMRVLGNVLHVVADFARARKIHSKSMTDISDPIGVPLETVLLLREARMGTHWLSHTEILTLADGLLEEALVAKMWHTTDARDSFCS